MAERATSSTPRAYKKSGAYKLKAAVKQLGSRAIDRRTKTGRALAQWRTEITDDLGGAAALSAQQRAVLDEAVKLKLMLDSIDAWILQQPSLVNKQKRSLLPVVRERQTLANALVSFLTTLGLERKARDVTDLGTYLATQQKRADLASEPSASSVASYVPTISQNVADANAPDASASGQDATAGTSRPQNGRRTQPDGSDASISDTPTSL